MSDIGLASLGQSGMRDMALRADSGYGMRDISHLATRISHLASRNSHLASRISYLASSSYARQNYTFALNWQDLDQSKLNMCIFAVMLCMNMNRSKYFLLLFLAFILVLPIHLHSQEKKKKDKKPRDKDYISIEFNVNYSFVLGKYGQTDKTTYKSGYAKNGWVGQLGLNWLGKRGWGLGFQYDLQHNGYKDTAKNINPYGTKYPLGSGGWTNNYLLVGPVFIHDFGKLELNVKALFGFILAQSTNFNVQNPIDQSNVSVNATGLGYSVYVGVGYRFNPHWGLNLNVNYLGGLPKATKTYGQEPVGWRQVKDTVTGTYYNVPIYSAATKYEIKRTVSTLNGGIGVIYHF